MRGRYIGKDKESPENHDMWVCPYCGKITYQGQWTGTGMKKNILKRRR